MLALSVVDRGNNPQSDQNKNDICCSLLSTHHLGIRADWLARTQGNASE